MQLKFMLGFLLILAAVAVLVISATQNNATYLMTVEELLKRQQEIGDRPVKLSGAVLGDTIQEDPRTLTIRFTIVHIPGDNAEINRMGGLAQVLHDAVENPDLPRLEVEYHGVRPDLLKNEAQAIVTGKLDQNGVFQAEELLLKCPTRYEEAVPQPTQP